MAVWGHFVAHPMSWFVIHFRAGVGLVNQSLSFGQFKRVARIDLTCCMGLVLLFWKPEFTHPSTIAWGSITHSDFFDCPVIL